MSSYSLTFENSSNLGVAGRPPLDDSPLPAVRLGAAAALLFFVVFLGWASLARLDAAAVAPGEIAVAGNRQTVQHPEGGVVGAIRVKEGQHVEAGQTLIELSAADVRAQERALTDNVINLQAQKARLEGEAAGIPIAWPSEFSQLRGDDLAMARRAIRLQLAQVAARRSAVNASYGVIRGQQAEIHEQASGYRAQMAAAAKQRQSLQEQLQGMRELAAKGFVSKNQIRQIERSLADLDGSIGDYRSRDAAAREQVGELQQQNVQAARKYVEDSAGLLRDAQFQLNDLLPKLHAARDALARTVIRAPAAGRIVGLKVFTVGGVIAPGQVLMEIVPDSARLVIHANFPPNDIEGIGEGSEAEVRFSTLHQRDLPILTGRIQNVSADALKDDASGRSYYSADVVIPPAAVAQLRQRPGIAGALRPGIPVQVSVRLRKRTALQYLLDPLTAAFSRSLHER